MFANMDELVAANQAAGNHWFDPATLTYFRGRIETILIDGRWFVSSEQQGEGQPRRYTIRAAAADATISTIGEFGQYETLAEALMGLGEHLATVNQ